MLQATSEFLSFHNYWQDIALLEMHEDLISKIEDQKIFIFRHNTRLGDVLFDNKKKISSLRGKLSKQTEEKIDEELADLRSEWENI